ncbi:recombination-associated protein RdgC [Hydrogenophaga sp. UC242_50]|uniref:recombination-associated protein RdgC n=1 Tax=unclassified Hydrogenophaga TaxID=2610897 RepID=UPI0036D3CBEC
MFKNVTIYRIAPGWEATLEDMEAALDVARFVPCGATQDKAVGWIEPRGEAHGPLVESVAGQRILKLQIETKGVPGSVVKKKAQEEADHIEATTGRKPGKKETKALREDALLALLPQAFARQMTVWVWIDLKNGWLVTDASSQGKLDEVVTALVRAFDGLAVTLLQTAVTPQTAMTQWLSATTPDEWPGGFAVERECELKSGDEEKSAVKFTRHNLATDEVRKHITEGKLPTRLAMSWEGRIGFTLTESLQVKKISFLEGVFDGRPDEGENGFDADVALSTGELQKLIPELIEALGGEMAFGAAADSEPSASAPAAREAVTADADDDGPPF